MFQNRSKTYFGGFTSTNYIIEKNHLRKLDVDITHRATKSLIAESNNI